jgi:hypothetical protein
MSFVGTPNCYVCNKKVYPVERMDADKKTFHKYSLSLSSILSLGLYGGSVRFGLQGLPPLRALQLCVEAG